MRLGCIGDDFTGSSDLGNTLTQGGMRTVQYAGVPAGPADADVDAGIVALKSRSVPAAEAIRQSLAALDWLRAQGASQIMFKYCSTFDSTPDGNIGPVAAALGDALGARGILVCPAFPGAGRTLYQGHLFVNDRLLSESGLENHPLNPMTDPDIRRWLARQVAEPVGHLSLAALRSGEGAQTLAALDAQGARLIVADAVTDDDLAALGRLAADLPLVTGGSGIARGLPGNFGCTGTPPRWRGQTGPAAILSGSCSIATRAQVERHGEDNPVQVLTPEAVMTDAACPDAIAAWALAQDGLPLIASSADPASVRAAQARWGASALAGRLDDTFAAIARSLRSRGVTRLIVAGGETSGAVTEGLGATRLEIGPEIAPGVPAMRAADDLVLALKSGNFGQPDFFARAARMLAGP